MLRLILVLQSPTTWWLVMRSSYNLSMITKIVSHKQVVNRSFAWCDWSFSEPNLLGVLAWDVLKVDELIVFTEQYMNEPWEGGRHP
jgi:hypothetical protein